jgi:LemA protein
MRRFYNANVRDMNNKVEMFPSSLIAGMGNFTLQDYFEVEEAVVREAPKVEL